MKILIVGPLPSYYGTKNKGGIASHVSDLAIAARNEGYDTSILATGSHFGCDQVKDGIDILSFPKLLPFIFNLPKALFYSIFSFFLFYNIRFSFNVLVSSIKILPRINSIINNITHIHSLHSGAAFVFKQEKIGNCTVTIHSYHDLDIESGRGFKLLLKRYKYHISSEWKYIHVSNTDFEKGVNYGVMDNTMKNIVHNGISNIKYENETKNNDICFVGSFIDRKRPDITIRSFLKSKLASKISLMGDGGLLPQLKIKYQNNKDVQFFGHLTAGELSKRLNRAKVLVVPSKSESFGLVYLEAIIHRLAVIGYSETILEMSNEMVLTQEERRIFCPFSSTSESELELAGLIDDILAYYDTEDGKLAMDSLLSKVQKNFSWDSTFKKLETIY